MYAWSNIFNELFENNIRVNSSFNFLITSNKISMTLKENLIKNSSSERSNFSLNLIKLRKGCKCIQLSRHH